MGIDNSTDLYPNSLAITRLACGYQCILGHASGTCNFYIFDGDNGVCYLYDNYADLPNFIHRPVEGVARSIEVISLTGN